MTIQQLRSSFLNNIFLNEKILLTSLCFFCFSVQGDSFTYNTYNNHGVVGLINMPTARFYEESAHGITLYDLSLIHI